MVISSTEILEATVDQTRLVNAGITKIPQIFILPPINNTDSSDTCETHFIFPVIDLEGINEMDRIKHKEIVDKVRDASVTWGFFQVVNHGIPIFVLDEMLRGARQFFEQDIKMKKQYYTRDIMKKVVHASNFDLYRPSIPAANWRDYILFKMSPNPPSPEEFPRPCKEILIDYSKHMMELACSLLGLLFEGLGLDRCYLKDMYCAEGLRVLALYSLACRQPELTIGTNKHSDNDFLTVLLQDHIRGLQVLHQNQWVDVPPTRGALVVNIGDLLQASFLFFSNPCTIYKIISVKHRVLANKVGPRVSVPCFFGTDSVSSSKLYGLITELLLEGNPPKYHATTVKDYREYFRKKGLDGTSALSHYKN
ncbi:hypothetical protein H5410_021942 [Solanum commersonii]|uniref:Fe2OG dioxygenase domain-containing protein n=1 Tax=Solanum commersonii TaxID=4109 RepID=A0A9J5ZDZ1_SOLCO|nr:hypothetical protein H5410_021942 [Solanum commersonii]